MLSQRVVRVSKQGGFDVCVIFIGLLQSVIALQGICIGVEGEFGVSGLFGDGSRGLENFDGQGYVEPSSVFEHVGNGDDGDAGIVLAHERVGVESHAVGFVRHAFGRLFEGEEHGEFGGFALSVAVEFGYIAPADTPVFYLKDNLGVVVFSGEEVGHAVNAAVALLGLILNFLS